MMELRAQRRFAANILLGMVLLLSPAMTSPGLAGESPQSPSLEWIHPERSPADGLSDKDIRRFESAWKNFSEGKVKKAQHDWKSLVKSHPNAPSLLTALSYIDLLQDQPGPGLARLEAALRADTKYPTALQFLARYFNNQKDYAKAYSYIMRLLELKPQDPQLRTDLEGLRLLATEQMIAAAHTARGQAKWKEAEAKYLEALSTAPELGTLARELGDIYAYEGKWEEAKKCYLKAIQLDATDVEAQKKLAQAYLHLNQPEQAGKILRELSTQDSPDEEIMSMLDKILAHSDPIEEAITAVRQKPLISRGDFGALLAVRFLFLKEFLKTPPVILTDMGSHWGRKYLPLIAGLDLISPFPNHQFRPNLNIRRFEVATAVDRLLALVNRQPAIDSSQVKIPDVPRSNPHRSAIERVVSLRIMELDSAGHFNARDGISGVESLKILDTVEKLLH
jgi:tetratricopeptide (TPR) repeat protein